MSLLLFAASAALATTWSVDTEGVADFAAIQDAIDAAASGDTIEVEAGLYAESINFSGKDLQIVAVDGPTVTVLDAMGTADRTVVVENGETSAAALVGFTVHNSVGGEGVVVRNASPRLEDLILSELGWWSVDAYAFVDGSTGGAIFVDGGSPLIKNCTFERNLAHFGGALTSRFASVTVENCLFIDNYAYSGGGAIWALNGSLTVRDSRFIDGSTANGGADISGINADIVWVGTTSSGGSGLSGSIQLTDSSLSISGALFTGNHGREGGCLNAKDSDVDIEDAQFVGCTTNPGYGSLEFNGKDALVPPEVTLTRSEVIGAADDPAVGVNVVDYGTVRFAESRFDANAAGLQIYGETHFGDVQIVESDISDSRGDGVAISNMVDVTIADSVISNNLGRGLLVGPAFGQLSVTGSSFCGNAALYGAAAEMGAWDTAAVWSHNVFRGNSTVGGALVLTDGWIATLSHNDFLANSAADGGAIVRLTVTDLSFDHNLIARNGDALAVQTQFGGTFEHNLWFANEGSALYGTFPAGNLLGLDPGIGEAWDGACPGSDLVPPCGSPVIEEGIGAFEGPPDCPDPEPIPGRKQGDSRSCATGKAPLWLSVIPFWVAAVRRRRGARSRLRG